MNTETTAPASVCASCGDSLSTNDICLSCLLRAGLNDEAPLAETRFGDFEIERVDNGSLHELGRGAMGVTYRAHDLVLNRAVALKVIETGNSQAVRERFLREARAAAALRHPNIATVFQFGASPEGERCYCAMELVEGETLDASRVRPNFFRGRNVRAGHDHAVGQRVAVRCHTRILRDRFNTGSKHTGDRATADQHSRV